MRRQNASIFSPRHSSFQQGKLQLRECNNEEEPWETNAFGRELIILRCDMLLDTLHKFYGRKEEGSGPVRLSGPGNLNVLAISALCKTQFCPEFLEYLTVSQKVEEVWC